MALEDRVDQVGSPDLGGLANAEVAGFAAIHQVDVHQVDLLDADVEIAHLGNQAVDLRRAQSDQPVGHEGVTLGAEAVRLPQGFEALALQAGAGVLEA